MPNSIVVSRGCPHVCDFCYKEAFFEGGRGFYTQAVDVALAEIDRLPGRHLYFLDDHLLADRRFAAALFDGMRGMGRLWQAASTVNAVLAPGLLERAVEAGIKTATFHILTPYSGTALHRRLADQGRLTSHDWDRYDTRHAVFRPARMSAGELEAGYRWAYREFYRWRSLVRRAAAHDEIAAGLRHLAYAAGWKKFEPLWDLVVRTRRIGMMRPMLESILSEWGRRAGARVTASPGPAAGRAGFGPGCPHGSRRSPLRVAQLRR